VRPDRKRKAGWIAGASALVALVAAVLSVCSVSLLPPQLEARSFQIAIAPTHVFIDSPVGGTIDPKVFPQHADAVAKRAHLLSRMLASRPALTRVGRRAGVPPDQIAAISRSTEDMPLVLTEPGSEERASQIAVSSRPYRLEVQARPSAPVIDIYAQAPSTGEAERLANAAVAGLRDYLRDLARRRQLGAGSVPLRLLQQGRPHASVVNPGAAQSIALLTFIVVFALCLFGWVLARRLRPAATRTGPERAERGGPGWTNVGDWPRTTRVLPWMFAAFLALLWLLPFNEIELAASLPMDLKLDRLVLPFIVVLWVFALVVGGRGAPVLRFTWIHAGVAAFLLVAFLSVVLNAGDLNRALEFEESQKRLPLLVAYASVFFLAASIVRRTEVRAFLTLTLGLALVCSLGIIWEYRFEYNVFYDLPDKLLPGAFSVGEAEAAAVDGIGRRVVRGPGRVPLEAVAMLSMALPIAIVGAMRSAAWRGRLLYGLAVCILAAAVVATFRKSALLAPASVILTLAYFRRRELLKLAPLGLVALVAVHALSPAALGSTVSQLAPDKLGVATVSERTIDYDAVRPEVWTHLIFGKGWGTYDHVTYRILDSDILQRVVETGVVGLVVYLGMAISVVLTARASIASRHPDWAGPALIGAAAAVSFIVVSFLFDVMSFPHVPYIFLYLAGLVAVVVGAEREPKPPASSDHAARPADRFARRPARGRRTRAPAGVS
jgi:hypothetical protein